MKVIAPQLALTNDSPTEATLTIFGDIGPSEGWFGPTGMIDTEMVSNLLSELGTGVEQINVRINSNGGDAYHGIGICNLLKMHPATIKVIVVGVAASSASIIAMAGDTIEMPANAQLMLHEAATFAYGMKSDLVKAANQLDAMNEAAIATYAEKTGLPSEEIGQMMADETWLTGEKAKAKGFADVVTSKIKVTKPADRTPTNRIPFKHAPSNLVALISLHQKQDATMSATTTDPIKPADSNATAAVDSPSAAAPAQPVVAAPASSPTVDLAAATEAGRVAEMTRQNEIRAACKQAGPEFATIADEYCADSKFGVADVQQRLLTELCKKNTAPTQGSGTAAPAQAPADEFAAYRKEYVEQKALAPSLYATIGEDQYIASRCREDGKAAPKPAAKT